MSFERPHRLGLAGIWRSQPSLLQSPFSGSIVPKEEAFSLFQSLSSSESPAMMRSLRLFRAGERVEDPSAYRPRTQDISFESYFARLSDQTGRDHWAVCLSEPQAMSSLLFKRLLAFLHDLSWEVGDSAHFVSTDLFALNHQAGLFGLHKDSQDVFTFVLQGRRRYFLWPFHSLADAAGITEEYRFSSYSLQSLSPAMVGPPIATFELSVGDVLYWPADWWHLSEAEGDCAVSLGVGIRRDAHPLRYLIRAVDQLQEQGDVEPLELPSGTDWLQIQKEYNDYVQRLWGDNDVRKATYQEILRSISAAGVRRIPPPDDLTEMKDSVRIQQVSTASIVWGIDSETGHLTCFVSGSDLRLEPRPEVIYILKALALGEEHKVGTLIKRAVDTCADCDEEITCKSIRRLLQRLEQLHGIERVRSSI